MKREFAAFLALTVIVSAWPALGQNLEIGKWLWISHCADCHGELGEPILPLTPDISRGEGLEKSARQKLKIIRNGSGVMPGFAGKLPEEMLLDIFAFMETLYPEMSAPRNFSDPNLM